MNNTILSNLSTKDKNKSFVTIFKDGASFDIKLSDVLPDFTNTATGSITATLNKKSGVVTFTENCETAPIWTEYIINNSLITSESIVRVSVQSTNSLGYTSLVSVNCGTGAITIAINDGFTSTPTNPIVIFEILN